MTRIGGVVSGASPAYNVEEMTYALRTANARFIATHPTSIDIALEAAKNAGIPKKHIFLLEGQLDGYITIKELIERGKRYGENNQVPYAKLPQGKRNGDVCALLSFSSGTTGLPKAVSRTVLAFHETDTDSSKGHDIPSKCHRAGFTDCTYHAGRSQKGTGRTAYVSHHRPRP